MASKMPVDPLQQFIQNHMAFEQFKAEQQEVGARLAMQQRQIEGQVVGQFADFMALTKNDTEREAVGRAFGEAQPELAGIFSSLTRAIGSSVATQRATAMGTRSPEDIVLGMRTGEGLVATAGEQLQNNQFEATLGQRRAEVAQGHEEFLANLGQRKADSERDTALKTAQLGLENRGLNIQLADLAQRGQIAQINAAVQAGMYPTQLAGSLAKQMNELRATMPPKIQSLELELSQETDPVKQQKLVSAMHSELLKPGNEQYRRTITDISDMRRSIIGLQQDNRGRLTVKDLPMLQNSLGSLITKYQAAKDSPAAQSVIRENYNAIVRQIKEIDPESALSPLEAEQSGTEKFLHSFFQYLIRTPVGGGF